MSPSIPKVIRYVTREEFSLFNLEQSTVCYLKKSKLFLVTDWYSPQVQCQNVPAAVLNKSV